MDEDYYRRVDALLGESIRELEKKLASLRYERERLWTKRNSEILIDAFRELFEAIGILVWYLYHKYFRGEHG